MTIITIPATGAVGIIADEAPQELPDGAWSSGDNVRFEYGYATKIKGHLAIMNNPSAAAYHIAPYTVGNTNFWIHTTLTGAFADDGTTKTDISGTALSGGAGDIFTSTVLGGIFYLNNQANVPYYWGGDTGTNYATLTGWDANWRCKALRSFKNALLALNVTKTSTAYTSLVKVSDGADVGSVPGTWDHTDATADAREIELAETSDAIVDGKPLGDMFVVYKQRSTYALQYTGGVEVMRYFRIPGDTGVLTQNCIANARSGHVILTASDVVFHTGNAPESIIDGKMRRWLFNRIDGTYFARCFVVANPAREEVWICYPENGETTCTQALVWNHKSNTFGVRDLPNVTAGAFGPVISGTGGTWDADTEVWDVDDTTWDQLDISQADQRLLMSSTASRIYMMDQTTKFDGTDFTSTLTRTGMALGAPDRVKLVRAIYPRIEGFTGTTLSIQVGGANDAETSPVWSTASTYTVGSTYKADTFASGRFISLKITGTSGAWRLKSCDMDVVQSGRY
jgi:hypothetical protein